MQARGAVLRPMSHPLTLADPHGSPASTWLRLHAASHRPFLRSSTAISASPSFFQW